MTLEEFRAELMSLIAVARSQLPMDDVFQTLSEEYHYLQGEIWLHKHYNGDPPPRITKPVRHRVKPVLNRYSETPNTCSEMSNACEQDEGA
jgi:hypothetical protein